jgi:fatty acid desaturase
MTDPTSYTPLWPSLDRKIATFLNDPRDTVFVVLAAQCTLLAAAGLLLFIPGWFSWTAAVVYWLVWALGLLDRYILMLHCTCHRPLFKKGYRPLRHWIPWVLGPFFGQSPETYWTHHMGMHHVEGNLEGDLSSTLSYQRDKFGSWLHYFGKFITTGIVQLVSYHRRKGNTKMQWRAAIGEASWLALVALTALIEWRAAVTLFVVPLFVVRLLMMAGNWGQHAFVDQDEPDNDFKSSITCINSRYNKRCFNDGYHIIHHRKPAMHYTKMASEFHDNLELYGSQDAIVFEGLDFFMVWVYLMIGRKDLLAKAFVRLPGAPDRTDEEAIALFDARLKPVIRDSKSQLSQAA